MLTVALLLLTTLNLAHSSDCDVAILDDPLDFTTLYHNRGGHKAVPFPKGTEHTCDYYGSTKYANPAGACCTGRFVDNVVVPLMDSLLALGELSDSCRIAVERVSCFACAREQTKFLSIDYQINNLPNSTAEIQVCRSTCHTVWEHCKNDPAFHVGGQEMITETRICAYLNDGIVSALAQGGSRVDVSVVEDASIESPECFLYDDLKPIVTTFVPPSLSSVNPTTKIFKLIFNERVAREPIVSNATSGGSEQDTMIKLFRMGQGVDAKPEMLACIDTSLSTSKSAVQLVTTDVEDDTLQIIFGSETDGTCLLDPNDKDAMYSIVVGGDVVTDRTGNVFPGVNEKMWSFGVDVKASSGLCASSKDPLTDIGLGVTAGVLVVLLLSGSCYCFVVKPRSSTTNNPRRYADFGDSGVTLDESENGPIQEGSMVTDANGKKLQVRLVPSYVSPNDGSGGGGGGSGAEQIDLGGVQEETKSNGQPSTSFV